MMKKYCFLILVFLLLSCQRKQNILIDSINVLYYNGLFERVVSIGCDEIFYQSDKVGVPEFLEDGTEVPKEAYVVDTIITDKQVLQEITNELKFTKRAKDYGLDARMKCYIKYSNGKIDSLCTEEFYTCGYYNGEPTRFTNKFAYLIRKNCGFYEWIGIDELSCFDELNDTTFVRETITNRWGQSY
jgi:hypothetical protein